MTDKKIINLTIFAVGDYRINGLLSILLVSLNHLFEKIPFVLRTGRDPGGGCHLVFRFDCPVRLVPKL
jgi:hypothetical protein